MVINQILPRQIAMLAASDAVHLPRFPRFAELLCRWNPPFLHGLSVAVRLITLADKEQLSPRQARSG